MSSQPSSHRADSSSSSSPVKLPSATRGMGFRSAAEVAKATLTQHTSTTAAIMAARDRFFIFIIARILSSMALLLKALAKGPSPLFCSSMAIRVMA